ncbi:MAG: glutamate mutase L, partial [Candidatus Cloacimonas acidaminovorans]
GYKLPVIYAGNKDAREEIVKTLGEKVDLIITDNIRPKLEIENLLPAREKIHNLFMEHVMKQAPGYNKLMEWTVGPEHEQVPIMPTPAAVGNIMQAIAKEENIEVVGVDIGGATTDIFSVFTKDFIFNRTVSANLGLSYSISNVLASAGLENIMRWVPFDINESELRNMIKNKMIRPTTIPSLLEELVLEQAIAKEALRLAFEQHKSFASSLKGMQKQRDISEAFSQSVSGETIVNMMTLDLLVGSGGVLSHAPRRNQTVMMLIDAFLPEGITRLSVDSIFMMPHLGVLSEISTKAATEVFRKDCMIYLGTCVAPVGKGKIGKPALYAKLELPDGSVFEEDIPFGEMRLIPCEIGQVAKATLKTHSGLILDADRKKELTVDLHGGKVGIVLDTRGRKPFVLPADKNERISALKKWMKVLNAYPEHILS